MALEIERKFLVRSEAWRSKAEQSITIVQGYLSRVPERTVRVRIMQAENLRRPEEGLSTRSVLTVKGLNRGAVRDEFEYPIPLHDAKHMIEEMVEDPVLSKTRYRLVDEGREWEVDVFGGNLRGLVLAEVELPEEDADVVLPDWVGEEVTGDARYYNSKLMKGRPEGE